MKILDRIIHLIPALPEKDQPLAHKFVQERDFISLYELVHSLIIRVRTNPSADRYIDIDLGTLRELLSEVDSYLSYTNPDWYEDPHDEEY